MTMLATKTENGNPALPGRALTLADYEARIHLYKEQIGTGYIGIGRTLLEAKEAKVVPHGQWESWVTETTGLTPRQAQRCMQAAMEIKDGSAMARLEMSKALMLLGSGLDEEAREEIAEKAADEGATVKALREEIRQAKVKLVQETGAATEMRMKLNQVKAERDDLVHQMKAQIGAYQKRMDEETEKAYREGMKEGRDNAAGIAARELAGKDAEIRRLRNDLEQNRQQRQSLQDRLAGERDTMSKKNIGLQNELNKQTQYARELEKQLDEKEAEYQRMLADCDREARAEEREKMAAEAMPTDFAKDREILLAAAEEAEKRAADAEAELEALKAAGAGQPDPAWKILKKAVDIFMSDCELLPISDIHGLMREEEKVRSALNYLETWIKATRSAMDSAVEAEGAVV